METLATSIAIHTSPMRDNIDVNLLYALGPSTQLAYARRYPSQYSAIPPLSNYHWWCRMSMKRCVGLITTYVSG